MAFKFTNSKKVDYFLHFRDVILRGGREQRIYFFAREVRDDSLDKVPEGYEVVETERTGMPVLRKKK